MGRCKGQRRSQEECIANLHIICYPPDAVVGKLKRRIDGDPAVVVKNRLICIFEGLKIPKR